MLPIGQIEPNKGQIEGLPKNPRLIRDEHFKKLKKSIEDNPEMLYLRELLVYPRQGKYITIGGNMRLMAMRDLGYTEAPCKVIPDGTSIEQLKAYTIKDNAAYGEWDYDLLANEWDYDMLDNWGVDIPVWDDDGDMDIAKEGTEAISQNLTFKCGKYKIPISEREIQMFEKIVKDYKEKNSVLIGLPMLLLQNYQYD